MTSPKEATKPVRVMQILARLNVGGPAIYTILLARLMNSDSFSTTLVTGQISQNEGDMSYLARENGVVPIMIPKLGREIHWLNDWFVLWDLIKLMRCYRPDVVHTHTAKAGMLGRLAAKLTGVPAVVHTFHGHVFHSYFSPAKTRFFLEIERFLGMLTHIILTVSPRQRTEILDYGIGRREKVHSMDLGLELKPFVDAPPREITERARSIGIVGRLVPVKNHRLFLDAAYRVIQKAPDVQFVIVGDGELRFELEQYASTLHLGSNVHFRGFCPNSPEIFADLDVVALTSLNEGTPVTLIEAMAAGKPVVATNVGGVGDLITNGVNGFLVPPNDADAFSEALLRVLALSDDQRIAIIQAGRSSVFPKYDILTATKRMGRLYGSLLRGFGLGSLQT